MKRTSIMVVSILVAVLILSMPFILTRAALCESLVFDDTGQIGDTIGGITAPFVGILSIVLLVMTLMEQLKFNKLQTKLTLDEQFKSTFFQMLDQHRRLASEIGFNGWTYKDGMSPEFKKYKGEDAFRAFYNNLSQLFSFFNRSEYKSGISDEEYNTMLHYAGLLEDSGADDDKVSAYYSEVYSEKTNALLQKTYSIDRKVYNFYRQLGMAEHKKIAFTYHIFYYFNSDLGRYFRHLYYILTILEREERRQLDLIGKMPEEYQKIKETFRTYANILPAQMSVYELTMLFYDCFLYPKMQDLIVKYDILQTLPSYVLMHPDHKDAAAINLADKTGRLKSVLGDSLSAKLENLGTEDV